MHRVDLTLRGVCLAGWLLTGCAGEGGPEPGPAWPGCPAGSEPAGLAAKAAHFDRVAREEHLAPDGLLRNLVRPTGLQGVERWSHVENVILWSGMYLASQAFRYAVTGEPEAQDNARRVLVGLGDLTALTGVRGLYGRSLDRPDVPYDFDGRGTPGWTDSPVPAYAGWAFRNDVSKDGYAGLMFGYAAALEHFDAPDVRTLVAERVDAIADHLLSNGLQIVDTHGGVTEHGRLYHSAFDDFPGFNAMLASSWVKIAQTARAGAGQDATVLDDFYYGCLMRMRAGVDCPDIEEVELGSYVQSMEDLLFLFQPNCKQNYDNFDMCYQAMYPLLRRERHDGLRERLVGVLRHNMFHTENPAHQSMAEIGWSFFTYAWVALTEARPGEDPVVDRAVELAACTLEDFPAEKLERPIPVGLQPEACRTRLDEPAAAEPIPIQEYRFDNYLWRLDPFVIQAGHPGDPRVVYSPEDYLVAYWLGRLHGILPPGR
jgi:hypothetical protein